MRFGTPLAWLQLTREKTRLLIALAGIAFAVILMFMQLGFQAGLYGSATRIHQNLQADLVLISARSKSLGYMRTFSWRRLYQLLSFDAVESVSPIYVGFRDWKNHENGNYRAIFVYGIEPVSTVFQFPEVSQNLDKIRIKENVLFDRGSRLEYGNVAKQFELGEPVTTELGNKRVNVVGLFTLGPSFAADGNVIMSDSNFLQIFSDRKLGEIDIGVIRLKQQKEAIALKMLEEIKATLPKDIKVLTRQGFIDFERNYWETSTAIGFIFNLGVAMGFIVGTVIVYQILYSDVSKHLAEYATLKAMGYKDSYLLFVVFQEAILLAILGYIPGFALSVILYELTKSATLLPLGMTVPRGLLVFVLAILMCCISGLIAVRRLSEADPADIF